MMIKLGDVELNPNMIWADRYTSSGVVQTARTTLGGRLVLNAAREIGGGQITLVATEETGWLSKSMVDSLMAMSAVPGAVYQLTFGTELTEVPVVFSHHAGPAVQASPFVPRQEHEAGDYWAGVIKLTRLN